MSAPLPNRSAALPFAGLAAVLALLTLAGIGLGSSFMPPGRVVAALFGTGARMDEVIVWTLRLPRVALALLAGAALATAGALMQRATRNPLAAPSVLGIVHGAALGVLVFFWLFSNEANALTVPVLWQPLAAALGALVFALAVGLLAYADRAGPVRLLLYGVALAALAQALVILMMIAGPVYQASQAMLWLAGSVAKATWGQVAVLAGFGVLALLCALALLRPLDQLRLDDDTAAGTGLAVGPARLAALALSVLLTAGAVSVAGGIGFVGLVAPHAARLLFGTDSGPLLAGSALIGAGLVLSADIVTRLAFAPLEVPAGALTALFGAPFFIYLLIREGRAHA